MKKTQIKISNLFKDCRIKVTNENYINGGYIGTLLETDPIKGILVEHDCGSTAYENPTDCKLILGL